MPAETMRATYFSRFKPTWDLGGGSRRMMQVWETLQVLGCRLQTSAEGQGMAADRLRRLDRDAGWRQKWQCRSWAPPRRQAVLRLREVARIWSQADRGSSVMDLALMDDPIYFLPLFESLKKRRIPVVAICHNLESLVPSQVGEGARLRLLQQELGILSGCRLVVTISREETWLLQNLGIPSFYYPYYPGEAVRQRLLAVRRNRCIRPGRERHGILMLVNGKNPQSGRGLEGLIAHWREKRLAAAFGPLLVAGFDSEKIFPARLFGADAQLLGTLENDRLDELLASVAAVLCYQEGGSGALTRIVEMLIAHVPVLANDHAARSYHEREGVIEFVELDGLEGALQRLQSHGAEIPLPRPPDAASLLAAMARVGESGSSPQSNPDELQERRK